MLAGLLALSGASASVALANVDALGSIDGRDLAASAGPSLLGPIDEHGRTGWACKPEKAAESADAGMGSLPQASQ